MNEDIRDQINREDILEAIAALDRGESHAFGPSTFYDQNARLRHDKNAFGVGIAITSYQVIKIDHKFTSRALAAALLLNSPVPLLIDLFSRHLTSSDRVFASQPGQLAKRAASLPGYTPATFANFSRSVVTFSGRFG